MIPEFFNKVSERVLDIARHLGERQQTLSFAESCTGGLAAASIAAHAGVSNFFTGAVVSYARHVKQDVLGVPAELLQRYGEVHGETARAMAYGACRHLRSDWAVAITGIAGPSGGSADKPVGFVCFAVVGPHIERVVEHRFGHGLRQDIQQQSTVFAFDLLLNEIR